VDGTDDLDDDAIDAIDLGLSNFSGSARSMLTCGAQMNLSASSGSRPFSRINHAQNLRRR
jgi:hypothetical protein